MWQKVECQLSTGRLKVTLKTEQVKKEKKNIVGPNNTDKHNVHDLIHVVWNIHTFIILVTSQLLLISWKNCQVISYVDFHL